MERLKAYKFRLYHKQNRDILNALLGFGRLATAMLDDRKKAYEEVKNDSSKKMSFPTAKYKEEFPFLKEIDSLALANAQLNLDKAYKNFFGINPLDFHVSRARKILSKMYNQNTEITVALIDNKFIKVPKLKSLIRIKLHRQPKGIIKSATISRHSSGKYYISLLCKEEVSELPKSNSAVGIDLGITDFAILSDGRKFDNNQFTSKMEKLKREQRKLSRRALLAKQKGIDLFEASNYQKQKCKYIIA